MDHPPPAPPIFLENGGMPRKGEGGRGVVTLIKPQFEAGRKDVSRGDGVIRKPEIHRQVLLDVLSYAQNEGFGIKNLLRSPVLGPKGNVEFLAWLGYGIPLAGEEPPVRAASPPGRDGLRG